MTQRRKRVQLERLLNQYPCVGLLGPRQVGKTTLAHALADTRQSLYLDLESPSDRAKLDEPELYLTSHEQNLVILDEIHRKPELYQSLRGLVDAGRRKGLRSGRFLLLGSASLDLMKQSGETLAGRIAYEELTPFDILEIDDSEKLWVRGGFPDSYLAGTDAQSIRWRLDFIRTYLERDVPMFGPRIPAETMRRMWTMIANAQGRRFNASRFARSLGVSSPTISRYVDLLVDLLLVRRLEAWHGNIEKRLTKSPRIFVRDSGLVHALLGLGTLDDLLGHPVVGQSWEGFIIENLLNVTPDGTVSSYYRTTGGAEVDLVIELPGGETWAIEIKRSLQPKPERGFHTACETIDASKKLVVYPGNETYPIGNDTTAVNVRSLADELSKRHQ